MHGKGSTGSKKFKAKSGAFYIPGDSSTLRPTAKMEPFIHRDNIPRQLLATFDKGMKTAAEWESLITHAVLIGSTIENKDKADNVPRGEEQDIYGMDEEFDETSTIVSGTDEDEYDALEINIEWDYKEPGDSDWAPMARAHRRALELLTEALKTTSRTTAKEIKELEQRMQADRSPEDAKARAVLQALVNKFGSVSEAVAFAVDSGSSAADDASRNN